MFLFQRPKRKNPLNAEEKEIQAATEEIISVFRSTVAYSSSTRNTGETIKHSRDLRERYRQEIIDKAFQRAKKELL